MFKAGDHVVITASKEQAKILSIRGYGTLDQFTYQGPQPILVRTIKNLRRARYEPEQLHLFDPLTESPTVHGKKKKKKNRANQNPNNQKITETTIQSD